MVAKVFEAVQKIVAFIIDILPIIAFFFGISASKLYKAYRSRLLRKVLSLKKGPLEVAMPVRNGRIEQTELKTSPSEDYITYEESKVLVEIQKMSDSLPRKINNEEYPLIYSTDTKMENQTNNAFIIGGIFANSVVQEVFSERFRNIRFSCSDYTYSKYSDLQSLLESTSTESDTRRVCVNGEPLFEYDKNREGYIVLIKLTGKADFRNSDHGTHHICFGNNSEKTLLAVSCYNKFRKELHSRLKKHKKHYFVIVKCTRGNQVDFRAYYDITDKMFGSETA